mmetsp:Transcript_23085/g.20498  ORF Transcript_23085/g.20498 Transcript_23085/m.20498 type:complete len:87 (-) Transcript_23085:1384-1644(-)
MPQKIKDLVNLKHFKVNFNKVNCVLTLKDAKAYGNFLEKYIVCGYDTKHLQTEVNIPQFKGIIMPGFGDVPEEISFVSSLNLSIAP